MGIKQLLLNYRFRLEKELKDTYKVHEGIRESLKDEIKNINEAIKNGKWKDIMTHKDFARMQELRKEKTSIEEEHHEKGSPRDMLKNAILAGVNNELDILESMSTGGSVFDIFL